MNIITRLIYAIVLAMSFVMPVGASDGCGNMQSKKKVTVLVDYFRCKDGKDIPVSVIKQLRENVIAGLKSSKRAEVMDVEVFQCAASDSCSIDTHLLNGENNEEVHRRMLIDSVNPYYILSGRVTSFYIASKDDGDISYEAHLRYTLDVVNADGVKISRNFSFTHGDGLFFLDSNGKGSTEEDAIADVLESVRASAKRLSKDEIPLYGQVLVAKDVKGKKGTNAYITIGEEDGVAEKDRFKVCVEYERAGRKVMTSIAEVKVVDVVGENISLVKIWRTDERLRKIIANGRTVMFKPIIQRIIV